MVIGVLVAANVGGHFIPTKLHVALAPVVAGTFVLVGRSAGLSWHDLALPASTWRAGAKYAAVAVAGVAGVYLVGVLVPATQEAFLDTRHRQGLGAAAFAALIAIPVRTVLLEEVAFRGVLWGLLRRRHGRLLTTAATSSLFGLWHILPSLEFARANRAVTSTLAHSGHARPIAVAGTVLFTALAGVVLAELRHRSGSLLAPAGLHWATNALGVVFSAVVWTRSG